jgi:1-acyl-sn-glycerol-3-phosphate acyltransferase
MKTLRTLLSWSGAALVLVPIALVLVIGPCFFRRERWDPLFKTLCRALVRAFGYQVRVSGTDTLLHPGTSGAPAVPGFVIVCNHVNLVDAFLLYGYLPGSFRGLEQLQHFSWPVYGALIRRFGNIALDQSGGGRTASALMAAGDALRSGTSLLILPEGHRTRTGRFGPFMRGAFRLAGKTNAVLVPVVQRGGWEVFHKGARHVSPGPVDLIVLPPWTAERRSGLDDTAFCHRVRQEMEAVFNQGRITSQASASVWPVPADCPAAPAGCRTSPDVLSSTENTKEAPCA